MDPEFLRKQKEVLKKQKEDLERELLQVAEKKKSGEKYEPKFIDFGQKEDEGAQEVATYEEYLVLERNLSKMLKETEGSLKKIEKGRYGLCESCKNPIEKERLEAFPTANLCLVCANRPRRRFTWAFWRRRR